MEAPRRYFSGDIIKFLEDLLQFIAGDGEELEHIANDAAHGVCGYVFQVNDLIYECRNCESHFSSVICSACFEGGNHKGHDYAVKLISEDEFKITMGGFCDCGDAKAWKPEGFCSKHQGRKTVGLSPALHDRTHAAFSLVISRIRSKLTQEDKLEELVVEVNEITQWVSAICNQFGEGFVHVLTSVIITPVATATHRPSPPSLLGEIFEMSVHLTKYPAELRNELHDLCYALYSDESYRKATHIEFMIRYSELIRAVGGNRDVAVAEKSSLMFDGQTFGWPLLALAFAQDGGFKIVLNEVLRVAEDILVPMPNSPNRRVLDSDRVKNVIQLSIVFEDLIMLLLHIAVSQWVVYTNEQLQDVIKLLGYMQGMGAKTRITGEHVEYEDISILDCLTLGNAANIALAELLVAGFLAGPDKLDAAIAEDFEKIYIAPASPNLLTHAKGVIDAIVTHIEHLSQQEDIKFENIDEGYISTVGDVMSQPVSIHYPLNRLLSSLVQKAMTTWNYTLFDLLGDRSVCDAKAKAENTSTSSSGIFPLILLDSISSVFAFNAHVYAAAWRKNGDAITQMAVTYKEDLAALQLCTCMLEPDHMLYTFLRRFKLDKWWELTESTNDEGAGENQLSLEQLADTAASFVWLLVAVARNNWVKLSMEDTVKMSLIHFLAVSPQSHSYLVDRCKPTHLNDQLFDNIVKQVSTHVLPHGKDQGKYHLKPEFWSQWDPYYYAYNNTERQEATEKYDEYCKSIGKYRLPFPTLDPLPSALSNMRNIIQSKIVHRIIFVSIRDFLASSPRINGTELTTVLHLLYQCLIFSTVPAVDDEGEITITDLHFPSSNVYKNSRVIVKHPALQEDTSIISMLLQLHKAHPSYARTIEEILELYCADTKISAVVQPYLAQLAPKDNADKDKLKNKRLEIMNQFKAQQKAFLDTVSTDENENSSPAAVPQAPEHICVLCKEVGVPHDPLHFMTLVTRSGLIKHNNLRAWDFFSYEKDRITKDKKLENELKFQNSPVKNLGVTPNVASTDAPAMERNNNNNNNHSAPIEAPALENNTNTAQQEHTRIDIDSSNTPTSSSAQATNVVDPESQQVAAPALSWLSILLRGVSRFIGFTLGTVARIIFWPFGLIRSILFRAQPTNANTNTTEDAAKREKERKEREIIEQAYETVCGFILFKDGAAPDISITSCPHLVHTSCFMKYMQSIQEDDNIVEEVNGELKMNLAQTFFLCPLCKTICNTLVPRVKITVPPVKQQPYAEGELEKWLQQPPFSPVQNLNLPSVLQDNVISFVKKVAAYDWAYTDSWELIAYNMCDKVATNVSHLEIAAREENKFLLDYTTPHQKDFLRNVATNFAITVMLRNMYQISVVIKMIMTLNYSSPLPSPLKIDTFDLYTIYTVSRGIVVTFPDSHDFLRLLYHATVMQALYTLTTKKAELEKRGMAPNNAFVASVAELDPESAFQTVALRFMEGDLSSTEHPLHDYTQEQIPILCLPFVRKVGLYAESCQLHQETNPQRGFTSPVEEFRYWLTYLHLPDITSLTFSPVVKSTLSWWVEPSRCQEVMPVYPANRHQLIDLPKLYSELLSKFIKAKCAKCNSVPDRPGLCLICGTLVCMKGDCCREENANLGGECWQHARLCGRFLGLFLDLKGQKIILIKITAAIWGSLYLDQYGEEDISLKRGVPLYLNEERYAQLQRLYLTKGLDNTQYPMLNESEEDINAL